MAKSQETFSKKEKEKKRLAQRKEKEERKQERKANGSKGDLESMLAYVDEYGNITNTPPDPSKRIEVNLEDIVLGATKIEEDEPGALRNGVVIFYNDAKGFGFIKDSFSGESIFVHMNQLNGSIRENDKVTFNTEKGPKGKVATQVNVVK